MRDAAYEEREGEVCQTRLRISKQDRGQCKRGGEKEREGLQGEHRRWGWAERHNGVELSSAIKGTSL